jgi:hypothetical protein
MPVDPEQQTAEHDGASTSFKRTRIVMKRLFSTQDLTGGAAAR